MGWKTVVVVVLTAAVMWRVWENVVFMQPWKVVLNHSPGPCHVVRQIENGSEDMQILPNGKVILSSGLKLRLMESNPRVMTGPGLFYIFDFNSPGEGAKVVLCNNFPAYGTKNFAPHGLSVFKHNGEIFLFVVNHVPDNRFEKDTIEKFILDSTSYTLTHLKTYSGMHLHGANDILAVGPESFYVTNSMYFRHPIMSILELLVMHLPWSSVVFYDNGKTTTAADNLRGANGINISPDLKYIYTVTLNTNSVHVFERKSDGALELKQSKITPTTACDNVDVDQKTGDVWLGCHPIPYKLAFEENNSKPSQVLRIKTKDGLLTDDVTEVYANDGEQMEASSVAVYHRESSAMIVGSVDRGMVYCKVNHLP